MSIKETNFDEKQALVSSSKNKSSSNFSNPQKNSMVKMKHFEKYFFFGLNILTFFVYGLSLAAFGVSVPEYRRNIKMDNQELSVGVSLSSVFGCISGLLAVWTLDKFNRQLQFGLFLIGYGIVTVIYPLTSSYTVYLVNSGFAGAIISYINSIPSIWVVELFPENPKFYLQVLHFFFPIGELAGPILVAPFLNKTLNFTSPLPIPDHNVSTTIDRSERFLATVDNENKGLFGDTFEVAETSDLWIPYIVISSLKWLIAILILGSFVIKPYRKPESSETIDDSDDESCDLRDAKRNLSTKYYIIFTFVVCLVVGIHWCNEQNHYNYISTYLHSKNIEEKQAAYGQGVLSIAITIGRLLNIFISFYVKVNYLIYVNFALIFLGNFAMMVLGDINILSAFASIVVIGLGFSSLYPFLIAFVEERVSMSNRLIALMTFSAGVFQTFIPLLIGSILDKKPENFIVLNLIITICGFVLYLFLNVLEHYRLKKIKEARSSKTGILQPTQCIFPSDVIYPAESMNNSKEKIVEKSKSIGYYQSVEKY